MHIPLLTYGSRGDIQPFLALAIGLQKAGHTVVLAAPWRFANFVTSHGVPFAALAGDPKEISVRINDAGTNPVRMVSAIRDYVFDIAPEVIRSIRSTLSGADLLIHTFLFTTGGHSFAREMGIPDVSVQNFPMFAPTRAFPNVSMANLPPGALSYFSHWFAVQVFWYGGNQGYNSLRKRFPSDLPAKLYWPFKRTDDRSLTPQIMAVSPTILPRPADWDLPHIHIPGAFFLDEPGYTPPPALTDFLAAGGPPICISFGSMVHRDAERIGLAVLEALHRTRQRGILLTGWGGWTPDSLPSAVFALEAAPHEWLLPRCSVIVHHGGAGTTAAGLRSGRPNVVVPFAVDQPFWGKRVAALGAGPNPIPVRALDADFLTAALTRALTEASIRQRAKEIGTRIQSEDGVGAAVKIIESLGG